MVTKPTPDPPPRTIEPQHDSFVQLHGVSWEDYERILEIRGDRSAPRIQYLEGTVEIMAPSQPHETIKSLIGRLVEVWCLERGLDFSTVGSWTLKERPKERGVEPDECYILGTPEEIAAKDRPDLAIEVVWSHGGLDKLEIYRKLRVAEVWFWEDGEITMHALRPGERYETIAASEVLAGIDVAQLASFLDRPTTSQAIREYRAALAARD